MKYLLPFMALFCSINLSLAASDINFSYNTSSEDIFGYGYPRPENYDICIHVDDSDLIGGEIRSMSVPIPQVRDCSIDPKVKVWVISTLDDNEITSDNSIAFVNAISDGTSIEADFPEGVIIPDGGLYIGYSLTVVDVPANVRQFPIAVVNGDTPGSLYFRCDSFQRWDKSYYRLEYMSPMKVRIAKEIPQCAVSVALPDKMRVAKGSKSNVMLTYTNRGSEPVSTFKYKLSTSEYSEEREVEIGSPAEYKFGSVSTLNLPFDVPVNVGNDYLDLELTEVNGQKNVGTPSSARIDLRVLPWIPQYRPLVEEYTGLWCGNCPSAYVALEEASDAYGDNFVSICYHVKDILSSDVNMPIIPRSVPSICINRGPVTGGSELSSTLKTLLADTETDVDLKVDIAWADKSKTKIQAEATAYFMENIESADYSILMMLVADNLSDPYWGQENYFSGQAKSGKYWDLFTKAGSPVYGLPYNSVPVLCHGSKMLNPSIASIKEFEEYSVSEIFNTSYGKSNNGVDLTKNKDELRVIAILIDNDTDLPVNAASSPKIGNVDSAVDTIEDVTAKSVIDERFYSMDGIRIDYPAAGTPYIVRQIMSDNSVRTCVKIRK